jgi:enoyl-CoA hydratase
VSDPVVVERRGAVLVITLNRPRVRNALNLAVLGALADALDALDADAALGAAILTGTAPGFSAGMDLKAFVAGEEMWEGGGRGMRRVVTEPCAKPLIAAVEGFAVAGGLELALACDVIVAGRSTRFGIPEVQRSIVAGGGALRHLPRRVGPGVAMRLALTGELIDGAQAGALGLVDLVAEDGGALARALELADAITANGPLALAATKRILRRQADWSDAEFWERQAELVAPVLASADAREGSVAFSEKRAPVWSGR